MPGKRRSCPGVRGEASRDPRDMAKAGLLEAESPEDENSHPPERHLLPAPCSAMAFLQGRRNLRGVERCPVRAIKEMSRTPKSRSDVRQGRTRDQPSGREPQGDGVPIVVVGVATHQGGRESRPQGEGAQVAGPLSDREVCVMQSAETVLDVLRERGRRGLPLEELYRQLFNPQLYLAGLRAHLLQQGSDDARTRRGNRGRHDDGQDRAHHRRVASRALPLQARQAALHPKEGREAAAAWSAIVVGQATRRSRTSAVGGVLRAAVLRALPWLPPRPRLSHRTARRGGRMDGDNLVYRR